MLLSRRHFLRSSAAGLGLSALPLSGAAAGALAGPTPTELEDQALSRPLLELPARLGPVWIERIELWQRGRYYVVRVVDRDGAEGLAVGNELHMNAAWPVLTEKIRPFFLGRDACQWEELMPELLRHNSNYKLQGLGFWLPLANLEFAVLNLLGRRAGQPVHAFLGGLRTPRVEVYQAFNDRHLDAGPSVARMVEGVAATGARAAKFKVGGRMNRNADSRPGRTEALIPLAREQLGADFTLYADSNGSYDVPEAIRIGRILQQHRIAFFEEPVPFDRFADTLAVAQALDIPIAGGEQDASMYNLAWMLAHGALQVAQPDLFYFGGFLRSRMVARMAEQMGAECVPHISGSGLGYLYMLHFVGSLPNAGRFHEFKGEAASDLPWRCPTSSLLAEDGHVQVPTGPGLGVDLDPDWLDGGIQLAPLT
jgi:L-alanine-DL-glutamate epimerase-like enolase superfamily enzyme